MVLAQAAGVNVVEPLAQYMSPKTVKTVKVTMPATDHPLKKDRGP